MERNKFWIIIALVVLFALAMEMIKDPQSTPSFRRIHKSDADINELGNFADGGKADSPEQGLEMPEVQRIQATGMSIAGLQARTEETAPAGAEAATPDKAGEKKDDKKKKEEEDKKKKEEEKKKKDKKKKKEDATSHNIYTQLLFSSFTFGFISP